MKSGEYLPWSEKNAAPNTKPDAALLTEMPTCLTSFGSSPSAWFTRFCTSTAARSTSRVTSKVTVIVLMPSLLLVDDMYCMPSTPLIASSSGRVTAVSTVSAFAPVYTEVTMTCGGVSSGYWAIGRVGIAMAPASTMTTAQTLARIGRLMKTSTNMYGFSRRGARGAARGPDQADG